MAPKMPCAHVTTHLGKCMWGDVGHALDLAVGADAHVVVDVGEAPDLGVVPDHCVVSYVGKVLYLDVLAQLDVYKVFLKPVNIDEILSTIRNIYD